MTPVFANTAWVHTRERLILRGGRWGKRVSLPVRIGVLERPDGVVLIDAGYSPEAISVAGRSLGLRLYSWVFAPELLPDGDPEHVLRDMGYAPDDVTAIVLTHFHVDHVSALARFPKARVIAHRPTYDQIVKRGFFANLHRGVFAELLPDDMPSRLEDITEKQSVEAPLGLGPAWDVFGDQSVLAVDLPGHAEGHLGLCFPNAERPFLYATDAQWTMPALRGRAPGFPASTVAEDAMAAALSTARIAAFHDAGGEVMLCHDPQMTRHDLKADK